jgi:hypothetical protein
MPLTVALDGGVAVFPSVRDAALAGAHLAALGVLAPRMAHSLLM